MLDEVKRPLLHTAPILQKSKLRALLRTFILLSLLLVATEFSLTAAEAQTSLVGIDCTTEPAEYAYDFFEPVRPVNGKVWLITNDFGNVVTKKDVPGLPPGYWQHTGIDYLLDGSSKASEQQTVYAAGTGVVVFSTNSNANPIPRRGGLVIIRHLGHTGQQYQNPGYERTFTAASAVFTVSSRSFANQEILTYYLHLDPDQVLVAQGDQVELGQPIARLYSRRNVGKNKRFDFPPHLHFEVWKRCSNVERNGYEPFGADFQQAVTDLLMDPESFLQASWRMVGHDGQHTWSSPFTGPATSSPKWATPFSDGGRFFSSPSIGRDGTIYVAGSSNDPDGVLYALNPDKSIKWQHSLDANLQEISPAIGPDGTVYIGANGKLYAFRPDGSPRWDPFGLSFNAPFPVSSPVIGADGLVYLTLDVGGGGEKLFAVDPNGATPAERIRWAYRPPADINGMGLRPLTIGPDGTVYALFLQQPPSAPGLDLVAITPMSSSGAFKWRFNAGPGTELSPPAIDKDGQLYVGASNGNLYALRPSGKRRWVRALGGDLGFSTPAIDPDDGTLYVGSLNGNLYAITPENGSFKAGWGTPFSTGGSLQTSPAVGANKVLYFTSFDGYSYAVSTNKSLVFSLATGGLGAQPSIGPGDTVYFIGYQSVYAVGPDPLPPDTTITGGPTGTTTTRNATFTWIGSDDLTPASGLEYASYLQGAQTTYSAFSSATSRSYANLPDGTYTFLVKARDQAGNEDPTPASRSFTVQAGGGPIEWCEIPSDSPPDITCP